MSGEEITETLRAEDTTFSDELVAAAVEVSSFPRALFHFTRIRLHYADRHVLIGRSRSWDPCMLARKVRRKHLAMLAVSLLSSRLDIELPSLRA